MGGSMSKRRDRADNGSTGYEHIREGGPFVISGRTAPNETFAHDNNRQIAKAFEAFMDVLQYTVVTAELLPYITFLHSGDFPTTDSQSQAFHRLCTLINQSEVPGKWQALIIALELAEYKYVVNLFRGEIENDGHEDREILNIFRPIIIKNINTAEVLDKFYERKVLNEQDHEKIQAELNRRGDIAAACMLLDKVPRREPNWFSIFVRVLRELKMDFLADELDVPTHSKVPSTVCMNSEPTNGGGIQVQGAVKYSTAGTLRKSSVSNENTSVKQLKTGQCDMQPPLPARSKQVFNRNPKKGGAHSGYEDQYIAREEEGDAGIYIHPVHEETKDLECSFDLPQSIRDQLLENSNLEMQLWDKHKASCIALEAELQRLNEPSSQTRERHHYRERENTLANQLRSALEERNNSLKMELKGNSADHAANVGKYSASNEEENHYTSTFVGEAVYPDKYHNKIGPRVDAEQCIFSGNDKEEICDLDCLNVKRVDTPARDSSVISEHLAHTVESQGNEDSDTSESNSIDAGYETTDVEKQSSATNEITELKQMIGELTLVCKTSNETIANIQRLLEKVNTFMSNEKAESDSQRNVDDKHNYVTCMQPTTES